MALASLPAPSTTAVAGCARRLEVGPEATALILDDGRPVVVAGRPDEAGARRCRQGLNHISSVRIEGPAHRPAAHLRGIGNRLPVILAIPLGAALALVEAGVPAIVRVTGAVER